MLRYKFYSAALLIPITFILLSCGSSNISSENSNIAEENLGPMLNSIYDEFGLTFAADNKILFTSNRNGQSELTGDAIRNGEDIFMSEYLDDNWISPVVLEGDITTIKNEGAATINPRTNLVIFARTHSEGLGNSDLYSGYLINDEVIEIKNLGSTINSKYWDSHPALSKDNSFLIFSSDRPGGYGGADLWISLNLGGIWSYPKNLGPTINTEGNEYSPSLSQENSTILCFSSDGRKNGRGNLDIYYTKFNKESEYFSVFSFDRSVNSISNEVFPYYIQNQQKLYFASDRKEGSGGYDLYSNEVVLEFPTMNIEGTIFNSTSMLPIESTARIFLVPLFSEVESAVTFSDKINGKYLLQNIMPGMYRIVVEAVSFDQLEDTIVINSPINNLNYFLNPFPEQHPQKYELRRFDLSDYGIPIFVSGYYKPSTKNYLNELRTKLNGRLRNAKYIKKPGVNFDNKTSVIEGIFQNVIAKYIIDTALVNLTYQTNSSLEIKISGYADPRNLTGLFYDEPIVFGGNILIDSGSKMNNNILSSLRAYFTREYLEEILNQNPEFKKYKEQNRIVFGIYGKGVYEDGLSMDSKRTVIIEVLIRR